MRTSLPILLVLLVLAADGRAQVGGTPSTVPGDGALAPDPAPRTVPIARLLDSSGALAVDSAFSGVLDVAGFRMMLDRSGRPVFLPDSVPMPSDTLDSVYRDYPGDRYWSESFGPPGIDGPVYALALLSGQLYVGGRFTVTGNVLAYNISRWNGRTWTKLRDGVGGTVRALAVYNNLLYVGGTFASAGGVPATNLAVYDPRVDQWSPVGFDIGTDGGIYGMTVSQGRLYITGEFIKVHTRGDDLAAYGVAAWNGTYWTTYGTGFEGSIRFPDFGVGGRAVAVRGAHIYVGGTFAGAGGVKVDGLAHWNGEAWVAPPERLSGMEGGLQRVQPKVFALLLTDSTLIVGGTFRSAGGVSLRNVARWNLTTDAWEALGGGLSDSVCALAMHDGVLYAGGAFAEASGEIVNRVARFDGSAWSAMDGGVFDTVPPVVNAIAVGDTGLFIGGHFIVAGTTSAHHVAWWDGRRWHALAQNHDPGVNLNGTDGSVFALATDGDRVYAGGDFLHAGGEPARRVAMWDGESWSPLGSGIGAVGGLVRALACHGGDLYVGGIFEEAGGLRVNGIARWDGMRWHALAGGVGGTTPYVFALVATDEHLIAGGAFTSAGGVPAGGVARWVYDTGRWEAVGTGVSGDSTEYVYVRAMALLGDSLFVGGDFARAGGRRARRLARWDGRSWTPATLERDSGANGPVSCLAVHRGRLFAGGDFTRIGDSAVDFLAERVGGCWTSPLVSHRPDGPVLSIASSDTIVYIGGRFRTPIIEFGQPPGNNVVVIRGHRPEVLREGVNATVHALCSAGGALYAGGEFTMAGVRKADHVAMWDELGWSSLGSDPTSGVYGIIRTVTVDGSDVYVGGAFSGVGGIRARNVARWNGRRWTAFGRGRENGVGGTVLAVVPLNGSVFVGGAFTSAGTRPIGYLAEWNGTNWIPLASGVGGNNPYVFALLSDSDQLYAGGAFATAGGLSANRIARFDTRTRTWHQIDSGVAGGSYYTYVSSIVGSGSDLDVAGNFALAGDVPANNIAHWDGTRWSAFGSGLNRSVFSIARYQGELYACGDFTASDTLMRYIARWNGASWRPVGRGLNMPAHHLATDGRELYAVGRFQLAGNVVAMGVARWDGREWDNLGKGLQHGYRVGTAYGVDVGDSGVYVGGDFTVAGGKASYYFGRWYRPPGTLASPPAHPRPDRAAGSVDVIAVPNPVSSSAVVLVRTQSPGHARITVTDVIGRAVAVLHDGPFDAGSHAIPWDAGRVPEGTYIIRATVNDATASTLIVRRDP